MNDIIVGIDLGTTNSAVAVVEDGIPRVLSKNGQKIIPSVVSYSKQSGWLVGQPALNQYTLNPENTVRSIKRRIGSDEKINLGGRSFSTQEISAFILREMKAIAEESLGRPVNKAVITVPAYFTNAQRQATKESGEIAGLEVVRIINEPTAAALAYGLNHEDDQTALVYDLGGGTFDVSVVEMSDGVVEVIASHGDTFLGGDDFDAALSDHLAKIFYKKHQLSPRSNRTAMAKLNRAAEAAKMELSSLIKTNARQEYLMEENDIPLHLETEVHRDEFQKMTDALLQRTLEALETVFEDAELAAGDLDRVLLVGGSTRMPAVWDLVQNYTNLEPDAEINPDEAVALGAAVQAAIIAGLPVDSILVDVTPYSLGIETAIEMGGQLIPDVYNILIPRNTAVPVTKEQAYSALYPEQNSVQIKVYQGESPIASENILLGDFMISGLKAASIGERAVVNVRFDFDVNGILHVRAENPTTGKEEVISVHATQARLTPSQIAAARERIGDIAFDNNGKPAIDAETQALLERANVFLAGGSLTELQSTLLKNILLEIEEAETQETIDELAEELLDMLFDLE